MTFIAEVPSYSREVFPILIPTQSHEQHLIPVPIFTAQCYAERGIATASRLSVRLSARLSVTLRYRIGWKSSIIISRLVSLGCSLSVDPNIYHESTPKGTP